MRVQRTGLFETDIEVAIGTLQPETQFIHPIPHVRFDGETWTEWQWGFVVDQGVGSTLVDITSPVIERTRMAPETAVLSLDQIGELTMATPNPAAANLIGRFKFQVIALAGDNAEKASTAEERIPKLLKESVDKGIALPAPSTFGHEALDGHPLFESFKFGEAKAKSTPAQNDEAKAAEANQASAEAKAQKKSPTAKAAVAKKVIEPHPCLCSCGATLTGKGNFVPGHDAKLKSRLLKFERGEIDRKSVV